MSIHPLEEILHPGSIAVVGASNSGRGEVLLNLYKNSSLKEKFIRLIQSTMKSWG